MYSTTCWKEFFSFWRGSRLVPVPTHLSICPKESFTITKILFVNLLILFQDETTRKVKWRDTPWKRDQSSTYHGRSGKEETKIQVCRGRKWANKNSSIENLYSEEFRRIKTVGMAVLSLILCISFYWIRFFSGCNYFFFWFCVRTPIIFWSFPCFQHVNGGGLYKGYSHTVHTHTVAM